jgi:transcription antitermination factor NusG
LIKPLFPNYLFARFNLRDLYHKVRFTRGVRRLVSFDDTPSVVSAEVIDLIRSRLGRDGLVRIGEPLAVGDAVEIKGGPFKDLMGIFERETKDSDRIMVLLQTASQAYHLVVDRNLVQKHERLIV